MEVDFDKEIDAILRKAHRDGPVLVGDFAASRHLDADEISAFAENALPEKSRALYMAHMAECDRCRKILSNTLSMNSEAVPATATPSVITIAERSMPWYKRLFLFPNVAYVMGSLVLIFGGFLAFTVVKNSTGGESVVVSQAIESDAQRGGPNFQDEPFILSETANSSANTASNVASSNSAGASHNSIALAPIGSATPGSGPSAGEREDKENLTIDGAAGSPVAQPPPPPAVSLSEAQPPKDSRVADDEKTKLEMKPATRAQEAAKTDTAAKQGYDLRSQSGPMRNNENQYNRQLENLDKRREAPKKAAAATRDRDEENSVGSRVVGGKTFERKQGVWYDVTFQGRPTINVRRGSDEYNRLDGGLRSIANSLGGTVVVVWGAKAYRIQ